MNYKTMSPMIRPFLCYRNDLSGYIFPMSTSSFLIRRSKPQLRKDSRYSYPCHHQHEQDYLAQHNKYRYAPSLLQLLVFLSTLSIILALFIPSYHCAIPTSNGGCSLGSLIEGDTSDFFFFERRKKQILTNNKCLFPTTTATFVHAFNPTSIPLHRRWIHTSSPPPSSSSWRLHLRRPPGNSIDFTVQQHQRRKEL